MISWKMRFRRSSSESSSIPGVLQSHVADFVTDQKVRALVVGELGAQRAELVGLAQLADEIVEGGVADEVGVSEEPCKGDRKEGSCLHLRVPRAII